MVTVLPSGRSALVERIVTWDGDLDEAYAPLSVTLVLNRELDISRGDLIVSAHAPATISKNLTAALVWMDQRPLERNRRYLLKHTSHTVPALISSVNHLTGIETLTREPVESLEMNGIGEVTLNLLRPIAFDPYSVTRSTGAFILIDPETNATVAAGMIHAAKASSDANAISSERITADERAARWGHRGGLLEVNGPPALINQLERSLFLAGAVTTRIETDHEVVKVRPGLLEALIKLNIQSGFLVLVVAASDNDKLIIRANGHQIAIQTVDADLAISAVHKLLDRAGILHTPEKADSE
jgi:hypothetical protein